MLVEILFLLRNKEIQMKVFNIFSKIVVVLIAIHFPKGANAQSEAAVKFLEEGRAYVDKKESDLAISSFTEAIKLFPDYAWAYNCRGTEFYLKKEYDIAISDHKEAIRIDPNYSNAHHQLGRAYYAKSNYEQAIKEYNEAIRLDPKFKYNYLDLGNLYYQKKDYEMAIGNYNEIIRLDPKDKDGYGSRASVYYMQKEYDKAINEYNLILRMDSTSHSTYRRRGIVYGAQKLFDLQVLDYTKAIRLAPKELTYYYNRGNAYRDIGENELAIKDYNEAVRISGKPQSYVSRAWFFYYLKQYDRALSDFAEAIRLDPKYLIAYTDRGIFYRITGQYDLALADYAKVLQEEPNNSAAYWGRASVQKARGLYQLAIDDYETAIKINPKNTTLYLYILSPLIRTGQFDKVKEYGDKYNAKVQPSFLERDEWKFYKYYLSVVTIDLPNGQYDRALVNLDASLQDYSTYSKAIEDNKSQYIDILALKGYVLGKLSRNKEAKEVYEQALVINSLQPDVKEALVAMQKQNNTIAITDKILPEIQLISPQAGRGLQIVSNNDQTEIIGKAKDASGIASVMVNGKAIANIEEDGLFIAKVHLHQGDNNIVITAIDKRGNTANKTFTLKGNLVAQKQEADIILPVINSEKTPQYHAILIGVNDYADPSILDLENPVKDASELKSILENSYTFESKNIETLYNKSREEIMQALVLKSNSLSENDNLLIFYAGHGIAEKDKFGDVDGYWIPSSAKKGLNASYISADDINKALKRSDSKHILVIADACFSGSFTRALGSDASVGIQKQYSVPSRKVMASGNLEPVPDNSRFIYYLKKNLKENTSKYLTAKKLFDSFYEAILNNSDTSPQYAAIKNVGDEGGEFVFIRK
jgi:tetratricopeptide (TPR) repeat protein